MADYPIPIFHFEDIDFGLRVNAIEEGQQSQERLFSVHNEDIKNLGENVTETTAAFQLNLEGAAGGFGETEVAAEAQVRGSFWGHQTTYWVSRDRLNKVAGEFKEAESNQTKFMIPADAGYLTATLRVQSSRPCVVKNFSVNVLLDGVPWKTLNAPKDCLPLRLKGFADKTDQIVLTFNNLSTQEMKEKILNRDKPPVIALEVPDMMANVADNSDPDKLQKLLSVVRSSYALVEVAQGDQSAANFVRAVSRSGDQGAPLDEFLRRVPEAGQAEWRQGPHGYLLANFNGRSSAPEFTPAMRKDGRWSVLLRGRKVDGDPHQVQVHPGDYVRLQYVTAEQYWGKPDEWSGYVKTFNELRYQRWKQEDDFWTHLFALHGNNAVDLATLQNDARTVLKGHRDFFQPTLPPLILSWYSQAIPKMDRFEREFAEGHLPRYKLTVQKARIWWNSNQQFQPYFTLASGGGVTVKGDTFQPDADKRGGEIVVQSGPSEFEWTLLEPVVLHAARDNGAGVLMNTTYTGWNSLSGILGQKSLDAIKGADPALSRISISCVIQDENNNLGRVPSDDAAFNQYLDGSLPRMIREVPPELFPPTLAEKFWFLHQPWAYFRSASLYKDLAADAWNNKDLKDAWNKYDDALAYQSRAMIAYSRSFAFKECAELAKTLPADGQVKDAMLKSKWWPRGETLASLRELGAAADHVQGWDVNSQQHQDLTALLRDSSSSILLNYILSEPDKRKAFAQDDLKAWRDKLKEKALEDDKRVDEMMDESVKILMQHVKENLHDHLDKIEKQLRNPMP